MDLGRHVYLDTNVYNRLADVLSPEQVRGLRPALAKAGLSEPLLSPVVVLEVTQTADEVRRERLVYLVQHLCAEDLLVEPEELVLDFIVEEMKRDDLRHLPSKTFVCRTDMARVWADVRGDWRKTLVVAENVRPGLKLMKALYRWLHALLRQPNALEDATSFPTLVGVEGAQEAEALIRAVAAEARKKPRSTDKNELLRSHAWLLAAALVGAQFSLFFEVLDPLWVALGVPARKGLATSSLR